MCQCNHFVSKIQFICIFINHFCNFMALQNIAKLEQKLCMIFEIFCSKSWRLHQYKSFASIFKDFVCICQIMLIHCKKFAILSKIFASHYKITQNQCKVFVLCSKITELECKKVVKDGIIWIKSKQSVKNIIILKRQEENGLKLTKVKKNKVNMAFMQCNSRGKELLVVHARLS